MTAGFIVIGVGLMAYPVIDPTGANLGLKALLCLGAAVCWTLAYGAIVSRRDAARYERLHDDHRREWEQ